MLISLIMPMLHEGCFVDDLAVIRDVEKVF